MSVNCRDPQCPWGSIEHYQHEPDGPIYALMGGPAVLLRDTPQDRERLAAALTSVEWHRWKSERVDDIHTRNLSNAIIAALRGKGNAGFYDDPNAEGNDR